MRNKITGLGEKRDKSLPSTRNGQIGQVLRGLTCQTGILGTRPLRSCSRHRRSFAILRPSIAISILVVSFYWGGRAGGNGKKEGEEGKGREGKRENILQQLLKQIRSHQTLGAILKLLASLSPPPPRLPYSPLLLLLLSLPFPRLSTPHIPRSLSFWVRGSPPPPLPLAS